MRFIDLFKTKFEAAKENESLNREVIELKSLIARIMKQYRSFGILSPSIITEASAGLPEIPYEVREKFGENGISLNDVDVVPRRDYVTLVESYNRINAKYLELIAKTDEKKDDSIDGENKE